MQAYYHSIETFGTVDGPGIRYVLFMAGCRLGCRFCHNPDTWVSGDKTISVAEILADYEQYRCFYQASGGGITVSGGEPLLQAGFVAALFAACRERAIPTVLDTSGYAGLSDLELVLPHTDMALFSVKAVDPAKHRFLTCGDNAGIIANLRYAAVKTQVVVRYVVIPGVNDTRKDILALGRLVLSLASEVPVELLAYHTLGREKWRKLGLRYDLEAVGEAAQSDLEQVKDILTSIRVAVRA